MEIEIKNNTCIIKLLSGFINNTQTKRLEKTISEYSSYNIGVDLDNVSDCSIEFLEIISKIKNLSFYNIQSDIFTIFIKMNIDKCINLYNSEDDFISGRNRLLNRKFRVIEGYKV